MFDLGRAIERRSYFREAIKFLAERGVNTVLWHFTDDQGCAMEFDCVPGIASPNAYSKAEMRELVQYAREYGIDLVPEVASLGHTVYLTRLPQYRHLTESKEMFSSLCPVAPESRPLLKSLIEEAATVFDSPNFHVGLDETNFGQNPLSAAALLEKTKTEIFADHINFIHGVVTGLGRQMWMWADGPLHDRTLAVRLPRDIVMCNWKYRPVEPTDSTQYLLDSGFDVVLCSATISSQQMLFPGERFALRNIRSLQKHLQVQSSGGKILGQLSTIWTPVRYMADSLWLGIDLSLTIMREGGNIDFAGCVGEFGGAFYGLSDTDDFVAACEIVAHLSPCRDEWLSVLRLENVDAFAEPVRLAAPDWAVAYRLLDQSVRPAVSRCHREFDTFTLMTELTANAYDVAAKGDDVDERAVENTERLLAAVEATWDRERYADDPRKYAAPIAHFAGDHLIPMMSEGLHRLRRQVKARSRQAFHAI